jgi:hypothetical protein
MIRPTLALFLCISLSLFAQEPVGVLEGQVNDPSGASVPNAEITARNLQTGVVSKQNCASDGIFRFSHLPVGEYEIQVVAKGFAPYTAAEVQLDIGRTIRIPVKLSIEGGKEQVSVNTDGATIDLGPTLGNVVSAREVVDLPLNGRNFAQLGLLQPGVAPMTFGLAEAGGALRGGQAYAVNGQRPESNAYLLDGVSNLNNVDGGYVIGTPVDAIAEFRILSSNAPAEYGGTSGSTTSVVTKSGGNDFHGNVWEFLRNDAVDARNFFASTTEPLHRNQYGGTFGGPIRKNKDFFFLYYEGLRDSQGLTTTSIVPTPQQRQGDFSGLTDPQTGQPVPLINYFTGQPVPNNQIPSYMQNPVSLASLSMYPLGNTSPSLFTSTQIRTQNSNQGGFRLDHNFANGDQLTGRFSMLDGNIVSPFSSAGSNVPGFPVADDLTSYSAVVADTHLFSPRVVQTVRASFFRNEFLFDRRLNQTPPSQYGFQYQPTLAESAGPPFLIVSGYASVGDPITGPRNTYQNNYAVSYSLSWAVGRHNLKFGGDYSRNQINLVYGIATNGFFVFAPFPLSDSFASFLVGQSVTFFQAGGQFDRGLRSNLSGGYVQDEWRISPRLMLSMGLRYEVNTPFTDIRNRMNAFAPGVQSIVYPTAPKGLLFPGDPGVAGGIARVFYKGLMPRLGLSWDASGNGHTVIRAAYGTYYDPFANGVGGPLQAPVSALPWTQANQIPGPGFDIANPYGNQAPPFGGDTFVRPATVLTLQQDMHPPYAQAWNFSVQQVLGKEFLLDVRYVGNKGTYVPRFIEGNPAVYGPGATQGNADQRRIYAGCTTPGAPCDFSSVGLISNQTNSTYHALQVALSRQFSNGLSFLASYWYAKSLDYVSSFNEAGSATRNVTGENDLAQNPFNLRAEHGPSLFDARQRFVFSATYQLPTWKGAPKAAALLVNGWQTNGILTAYSGSPFTVYDSANVSLQGSAPEITGFWSSRPNMISNPNNGPHTPDQWVSGAAFQRLDPTTQAGQFGNEGRNAVRGPGAFNLDLSVFKNFPLTESAFLQFRAECFNSTNHANFFLPENDIASQNFGRILQAGSPRLFQFALKLNF